MKRKSIYDSMTASDLARITRERGLNKPDVITLRDWANFLEADDAKRTQQSQAEKADSNEGRVISDEEAANMPDAELEIIDGDRDEDDALTDETPAPTETPASKKGKR